MMKTNNDDSHVLILGAGNFGTCLAQHLAKKGERVIIYGRSIQVIDAINQTHRNPRYLPDIDLDPSIQATNEVKSDHLIKSKAIVLAIPTQLLRGVLISLKNVIKPYPMLVCAVKGIENKTLMLPLQIVEDVLGREIAASTVILSGPSFASEVVLQQPTAVSIASFDANSCKSVQRLFHTNYFRAYTSNDPIGLEVAGALKNVMAIAIGACYGLGLQQNAQAALLTRSLAEMTRVGVAMGANPITFTGLGGVGDLFLTCTSRKSRNFSLGFYLGQGASLEEALRRLGSTAEGYYTSQAAYLLSQQLGTDTPIIDQVYQVLFQNKSLGDAMRALMSRAMKEEITLPDRPESI